LGDEKSAGWKSPHNRDFHVGDKKSLGAKNPGDENAGYARNKLSNKTNLSSLNIFSCRIQIFKVTIKVSYFLQNFENLQRFFTGEPCPWRPWRWCPQGGFRG
jgi:hypothetical protein